MMDGNIGMILLNNGDGEMSRKYMNNRWCVRCGKDVPTPYLRKNLKLLPTSGRVLDIGCGNGRNSKYMIGLGYQVDAIDMFPPDFGKKIILGQEPLPHEMYDIILANYILMFLNDTERENVMWNILANSRKGSTLIIEMYPAKDGYTYNFNSIVEYYLSRGWDKLRMSKSGGGKCVLRREN